MSVELIAPAKVNVTLEVLARRPDGYHEIATLMQTIDLCDRVGIGPATGLELELGGEALAGVPVQGARNLAYKAALALMAEAGNVSLGARILLEKHIPAGMGLGGGSSDAAAVLRGLNRFWGLDLPPPRLAALADRIGSDVPFFLEGGTAVCTGRGEVVEPLPDCLETSIVLFLPDLEIEDKTRRMYSLITENDFTDGSKTKGAAATVRKGTALTSAMMASVFEGHLEVAAPPAMKAIALCRQAGLGVQVAGSGPAFLALAALAEVPDLLRRQLADLRISILATRTLPRARALDSHQGG